MHFDRVVRRRSHVRKPERLDGEQAVPDPGRVHLDADEIRLWRL
jgi:hypothetical protein